MIEKKKKIIIGASIAGIVLLLAILIIVIVNNKKTEGDTEKLENVELSEIINKEDIENLPYEIEKTKEDISSKYVTGANMYELNAIVNMQGTTGKMIYVRGTENLNVYKTQYTLDKYGDKNTQINEIIETFEEVCKNYMIIDEEYKETDMLYGESSEELELPIEESIYNEERLYSKTYKSEENEYDINFWRQDNKIICEFVKIF